MHLFFLSGCRQLPHFPQFDAVQKVQSITLQTRPFWSFSARMSSGCCCGTVCCWSWIIFCSWSGDKIDCSWSSWCRSSCKELFWLGQVLWRDWWLALVFEAALEKILELLNMLDWLAVSFWGCCRLALVWKLGWLKEAYMLGWVEVACRLDWLELTYRLGWVKLGCMLDWANEPYMLGWLALGWVEEVSILSWPALSFWGCCGLTRVSRPGWLELANTLGSCRSGSCWPMLENTLGWLELDSMLDWLTLSSQGGCWMTLDFENYWKKRIFYFSYIFWRNSRKKKQLPVLKIK